MGNAATPQLIRNAHNVIDNFVHLAGRSFADLSDAEKRRNSAQVLDEGGKPAFRVQIDGKDTVLSVHDVLVRFIGSLYGSAKDFLSGVPIAGAVLSVPLWYTDAQIKALEAAAKDAGVAVLQIIPVSVSPLVAYGLTSPSEAGGLPDGGHGETYAPEKVLDRTVMVVDFGGTSCDVTLVAARAGIYSVLSYVHDATIGGRAIDDALVAHFAREFAKKTKVTIGEQDARAWAKLRNEAEVAKRALSASNSAQCSVESLAEGIDFSGSVNRMRLNLLAGNVYAQAQADMRRALEEAHLDACQVDEVVFAGGSARLNGLVEQLELLFSEDSGTQFTASIDSDQVIARGNALYAQTIVRVPHEAEERRFIESLGNARQENEGQLTAAATSRPVGVVLDAPQQGTPEFERVEKQIVDGQLFVTLLAAHTPVPARRTYRFPAAQGEASVVRLAYGTPEVRVDHVTPELDEEDEEEEPPEPEEVKTALVRPDASRLLELVVPHAAGSKAVVLELVVEASGALRAEARLDEDAKVVAEAVVGA